MTPNDSQRIHHLFKLANIAQEFEFVDLKLVDHFSRLREEFGLARLLLLIEEHIRAQTIK